MTTPEGAPPTSETLAQSSTSYPVTVGQARAFMRNIIEEEFAWKKLQGIGAWGGHLHRAVLGIALLDETDDFTVDIIPLYVAEYIKQPSWYDAGKSPEAILRGAQYVAEQNALEANKRFDPLYEARRDHAIEEFQATFGYYKQGELTPAIIDAFDEETNRRLRDKYFYPHNSITGERYDSPEHPEDMYQPIPAPQQP